MAGPDLGQVLHATIQTTASKAKIAGAAGVVFTADKIIAEDGFGISKPGREGGVDPKTTLFRLGSMSKPVTATAVMQLVEAGKLDLDADVNRYLDFRIKPAFGQPVTLRDLLTHTAGFSDTDKLIYLADTRYLLSLGDYVKTYQPPYLYRPRTTPAYSNYGFALAGYIVQRVSGERFESYVERHIFAPLGMRRSTFIQPPPGPLRQSLSDGFTSKGKVGPFEYVTAVPAGALAATVDDYARFLRAIMRHGELDGQRILSPISVEKMLHFNDFSQGVRESNQGIGLAFTIDLSRPSGPIIGHGGDTEFFHSTFAVYPSKGVGVIVTQNTLAHPIRADVVRAIEAALGIAAVNLPARPDPADDRAVAGTYAQSRLTGHSVLTIARLLQQEHVSALKEGGITFGPSRFVRVGPLQYQNPKRPDQRLYFMRGPNGVVDRLKSDPYGVSLRVPMLLTQAVQIPVIVATGLLCSMTLLGGVAVVARRLVTRGPWPIAWSLGAAMGAGFLLCATVFVSVIRGFQGDVFSLTPARDPLIRAFQACGVIGAAAGISVAVLAALRARQMPISVRDAIGYVACGATTISAVWLLFTWRLLDLSLHY